MKRADVIVMVQPCGRSAALELGWGVGAGKRTCVLLADGQEPELMLKCADRLCTSLDEVLAFMAEPVVGRTVTAIGRLASIVERMDHGEDCSIGERLPCNCGVADLRALTREVV